MDVEQFRTYCLSLPFVTEKMPFLNVKDAYSREVLCFYIGPKWFCYVNIQVFDRCCLKMKSEDAIRLREQYDGIRPAWHMNKKHWSDVYFCSDVNTELLKQLVRQSYDLVKQSVPQSKLMPYLNGNCQTDTLHV
ncbi:MAG: MmcQ/YjbR family DNA-binding protein [Bacteroidales bacterium]|nr:MmcQ/YjbR family DNA-binding protein [Bacteroidales bacterium]